jgi:hypothetical protein
MYFLRGAFMLMVNIAPQNIATFNVIIFEKYTNKDHEKH